MADRDRQPSLRGYTPEWDLQLFMEAQAAASEKIVSTGELYMYADIYENTNVEREFIFLKRKWFKALLETSI